MQSGDPIAFSAIVFEGEAPFWAQKRRCAFNPSYSLGAPAEIEIDLPDSGPVDPQSGDGHHIGLWDSGSPGNDMAAIKVTGTSSTGLPFSRIATANFTVLKQLAYIDSIADSAVDDNGDGAPDRVVMAALLTVTTPGNYQLVFYFVAGRYFTSRTNHKVESGPQRIEASLSFATLASLGADGPYAITDVFLIHTDDPEEPIADRNDDAGLTGAYVISSLPATKPLSLSPLSPLATSNRARKERSIWN